MSDGGTAKWIGDDFWVVWPHLDLSMEFRAARVLEEKPVELRIVLTGIEVCWDRISPGSARSRMATAQHCQRRLAFDGWATCLDAACRAYVEATRAVETSEVAEPLRPSPDAWLVPRWLPRHYPTVIYAEGGAGKGFWTLAVVLAALTGAPMGAWHVATCRRALWLDWEYGRSDSFRRRLWHFLDAGCPAPGERLRYLSMQRPLGAVASAIRGEIARHEIDLLVVDSLAPASGVDPESANASVGTLQSLTSLRVSSLLIAHLSKAGLADSEALPYGSIFNYNLIRSAIRLAAERTPDGFVLTAVHRKSNEGARVIEPAGFRVRFGAETGVWIEAAAADRSRGELRVRLLHRLEQEGPLAAKELAKNLTAPETTVKDSLRQLITDGHVSIARQGQGRGHQTLYELKRSETNGKLTETDGWEQQTDIE